MELRQMTQSQAISISQLMKNIEISEKLLKQAKGIQDRNGRENSERIKSAT
jgi:hypothetical protein